MTREETAALPKVTRFKAPERLRLTSEIEVARSQITKTSASTPTAEWVRPAEDMLERAEAEAGSGDLDNGWKYLHEARRQELFGLDLETLGARKQALEQEASQKLGGWRKEAVARLLAELDPPGSGGSVERWRKLMYEAQKTRDEHTDNVYFRNRLLRKQMTWIAGVLTGLVLGFIGLLWDGVGEKGLTGTALEVKPVALSMVLGAMGACLSALITFATSTTQVSIPGHLANVSITLTRPLIGAVSGAAAVLMLKSGVVAAAAGAMPFLAPFLFGFSERVVIGALKPKE
jgi:hypothetical protein